MFSGSAACSSCACRFSHSPTRRCDLSAMSAIERPTTDGSGTLNPGASNADGADPDPVVVTFPAFLSLSAIETSFASATPAATQAADSGERNQYMVVSESGGQASCVKKPGQATIRGSVLLTTA